MLTSLATRTWTKPSHSQTWEQPHKGVVKVSAQEMGSRGDMSTTRARRELVERPPDRRLPSKPGVGTPPPHRVPSLVIPLKSPRGVGAVGGVGVGDNTITPLGISRHKSPELIIITNDGSTGNKSAGSWTV